MGNCNFVAVICDLERNCVLAVLPDRKMETLKAWVNSLSDEQRAAITTVSMDMWGPYRHFCKKYLPKAQRVADRFHVMMQLNKRLGQARIALQNNCDAQTKKSLKGIRWLLVSARNNLSAKQDARLMTALDSLPELKRLYLLKEEFRCIFEHIDCKSKAQRFLWAWICQIQLIGNTHFLAFCQTLRNWWGEILNYFNARITNGFVEGINRAIRSIIWRACGFRNFECFRLQILAQHGFP